MMKNKINAELIHSEETYLMIEQQYIDDLRLGNIKNSRNEKILNYILGLDEFKKGILILYFEYNSYRKVADETNVSYYKVFNDIKKLKKELLCL